MVDKIFKNIVYRHIKRMIGFVDRDPDSPTFGCADRNYWHYKIHDYSNARMQEVCLSLAFCYRDKGSEFYQNEKLFNIIKGIIDFWIKSRNRNGSVNEVYPHEQSFCGASFSLAVILETIELPEFEDAREKHKKEFFQTGRWLLKNNNWHIANQIAASILALYNLGSAYKEKIFIKGAEERLRKLLLRHQKKGFFEEYGAYDLGYTTVTMSLLMRLYQKNNDENIKDVLLEEAQKINKQLDNYGRYDNMNMSRQTEFIYPFSFKIFNEEAVKKIVSGLREDKILNPDWLDDRYLIGLSNDYLMTYFF